MGNANYSRFRERKAVAAKGAKVPSPGLQVGSRGSATMPQKQGYAKSRIGGQVQPKRRAPASFRKVLDTNSQAEGV